MKLNRKNDMPVEMEQYSIIAVTYTNGKVETSVINYYQGFCDTSYFAYLWTRRDKVKNVYRIDVDTERTAKDGSGMPYTFTSDVTPLLRHCRPISMNDEEEIPLF